MPCCRSSSISYNTNFCGNIAPSRVGGKRQHPCIAVTMPFGIPCCRYVCCPCLLCCPGTTNKAKVTAVSDEPLNPPVKAVAARATPARNSQPQTSSSDALASEAYAAQLQNAQDYEDLQYLAMKREIRVTIRTSTKAGIAAGLSVMAGTIVAGPAGAVAGGAVGTAIATKIAKDIVPLNELLEKTPPDRRGEVVRCFNEAFREEFVDTIESSPELKLIMAGHSPLGVVRYMVDRDLVKSEKLEKLDGILRKVM
ncbi:hypothetical protein ACHAWF_001834 [Thalassiosira exigua]